MDTVANTRINTEVKEEPAFSVPCGTVLPPATPRSESPRLSLRPIQTLAQKLEEELKGFALVDSGKSVVPKIKIPDPDYEKILVRLLILLGMDWSQDRARHALLLAAALGQTSTVRVLLNGKVSPNQACRIESVEIALGACGEVEELMARDMEPKPAANQDEELMDRDRVPKPVAHQDEDSDEDSDEDAALWNRAGSELSYDTAFGAYLYRESGLGLEDPRRSVQRSCLTPLMCAAAFGYSEIVDALLDADAVPDHPDGIVQALTCALIGGHIEIAKKLILKNASVEGSFGNSEFFPLSIAAGLNDPLLVDSLLQKNADVGRLMPSGKPPLFNAVVAKRTRIVQLLIQAGSQVSAVAGERCSMLMFAAMLGHVAAVSMLLEAGAKADYVNAEGMGALTLAVQKGHAEIVNLLLDAGASCHEQDRLGRSAAYFAALGGHAEILRLLCARGAQLEAPENSLYSPLHAAAAHGHVVVVEMLLERGAGINRCVPVEGTALMVAGRNREVEVLYCLISRGAEVGFLDENNTSALLCAARSGDLRSVKILMKAGSPLATENYLGEFPLLAAAKAGHTEVVKFLLENHVAVDTTNRLGETALLAAAAAGKLDMVTLLLFSGARVNHVNRQGRSALALAVPGDFLEVVALLYDYEEFSRTGNPDQKTDRPVAGILNRRDSTGMTPLMLAAEIRNPRRRAVGINFSKHYPESTVIRTWSMLPWLVSHGADVLACDHLQRDALMLAAKAGNYSSVRLLLNAGASVDRRDFQGRSVLMYAAQGYRLEFLLDLVLEPATPIDLEDQKGHTALMLAAAAGSPENISSLLKAGADINHVSEASGRRNALMFAVEAGAFLSIFELLKYPSVQLDHVNDEGLSCLMLAARKGDHEIASRLLGIGSADLDHPVTGMNAFLLAAQAGHDRVIDAFSLIIKLKSVVDAGVELVCSKERYEKVHVSFSTNLFEKTNVEGLNALEIAIRSNHSNVLAALIFHGAASAENDLSKAIEMRCQSSVIDTLLYARQIFALNPGSAVPVELLVPIPIQGAKSLLDDLVDLMQKILLEEMTEETGQVFRKNALGVLCGEHRISHLLSVSIVEGLESMIGYQQDLANAGALPSDAQLRLCCAFVLNSAQNLHMVLNDEVSSLAAYGRTPANEKTLYQAWHLHRQLHGIARHQALEIIALGEAELNPFLSTFGQALAKTKTYNRAGVLSHLTRVLGLNPLLAEIVAPSWVATRSQQNPEVAFAIALEKALKQKAVLDQLESDQSEILRGFFVMQADCLRAYCTSKIPAAEKAEH